MVKSIVHTGFGKDQKQQRNIEVKKAKIEAEKQKPLNKHKDIFDMTLSTHESFKNYSNKDFK